MKFVFAFLLAFVLAPAHSQNFGNVVQVNSTKTIEVQPGEVVLLKGAPSFSGISIPRDRESTLDGNKPEFIILGSKSMPGGMTLTVWTNLPQFQIYNNVYGSNTPGVQKIIIMDTEGKDFLPRDVMLHGKKY